MKISHTATDLLITFEGTERFWAFKKNLIVPKKCIVSIDWSKLFTEFDEIWRVAGTGAPGMLFAGHFRGKGKWQFLFVRKPKGLFWRFRAADVLEIKTRNFIYAKVLLSVDEQTARELIAWHTRAD
jgi:hypothetical protein